MTKRPNPFLSAGLLVFAGLVPVALGRGAPVHEQVAQAESMRIEMIDRVSPSVVCVFDGNRRGGGSGVLISPDGYGLTNYHVVAGLLRTRRGWGGLGDRVLYELEVLGIDMTGDVAMFRLIPPREGFRFPYSPLGDSESVRVGDTVFAMGNPFILSDDYTPSVSMGLVTGTHRYQEGVRGNLAYTDCIQIDASINPGNSGGPLFNEVGEVIGINGRISVNTRGRFNVGFGYAISSEQIKRFMPALRAGLLAMHGTWQARVEAAPGKGVVFSEVRQPGPAFDAGIRTGDRLVGLDGRPISVPNQVASLLGTYPADWPLVLEIERDATSQEVIVPLAAMVPHMKAPFQVTPEVNVRELKRVLRRHREVSLAGAADKPPTRWRWTVVRRHEQGADGKTRSPERFEAVQTGTGPIRYHQRHADGTSGRLIEFDRWTASQRAGDGAEPFDLLGDDRMVLGALYTAHRWLRSPVEDYDLTDVVHAGGGAMVVPGQAVSVGTPGRDADAPAELPLLEVIQWPLGEEAVARFSFGEQSALLVRIVAHDTVSGNEATILLSDHRDVGGVIRPCTIEVRGAGYAYRETLGDWELSP